MIDHKIVNGIKVGIEIGIAIETEIEAEIGTEIETEIEVWVVTMGEGVRVTKSETMIWAVPWTITIPTLVLACMAPKSRGHVILETTIALAAISTGTTANRSWPICLLDLVWDLTALNPLACLL
jgi:hypothetical protein